MMSLSAWMRAAERKEGRGKGRKKARRGEVKKGRRGEGKKGRGEGGKEEEGRRQGGKRGKRGEEGAVPTIQVLRGPHSPSPCSAAVVSSFTMAKRMHTCSLGGIYKILVPHTVTDKRMVFGSVLPATMHNVFWWPTLLPCAAVTDKKLACGYVCVHQYIIS